MPEVNPGALKDHKGLIANANCSTIQMVVTLAPLIREFGIQKVVVSTYQAVSGSGRCGVDALENGRADIYPKPIDGNAIPLIGHRGGRPHHRGDQDAGGVAQDHGSPRPGGPRDRRPHPRPHRPLRERLRRAREGGFVARGHRGSARRARRDLLRRPGDFPTPLEAAGDPGTTSGGYGSRTVHRATGASRTTCSRAPRPTPCR